MRISGTEPSSVILSQINQFHKASMHDFNIRHLMTTASYNFGECHVLLQLNGFVKPPVTKRWLVGWLVVLRINVDLAIFQPYLDLEAGDNQSLKIQVARPGIEPRSSCSASQELNHSATAVPVKESKNNEIKIHAQSLMVPTIARTRHW